MHNFAAFIEGIRAEVDLDPSSAVTVIGRDLFDELPGSSNHRRRMRVPDHMREIGLYVQFAAREAHSIQSPIS